MKHNGKHPWRAANDFYNFLSDCCILADKVDDDFYCAEAGIEVAMSLVLGGKPRMAFGIVWREYYYDKRVLLHSYM